MTWKFAALASVVAMGIVAGVGVSEPVSAGGPVSTEAGIQAMLDSGARTVHLARNARIYISTGLTHTAPGSVSIVGNRATLLAPRAPGDALVFSGGGTVTISDITLRDGANRGVVVEVPPGATGTTQLRMRNVTVRGFRGHGIYVDDSAGSDASVRVDLTRVTLWSNGYPGGTPNPTGGTSGLTVVEAGPGGISARLNTCLIQTNKGDGIHLDESDDGDVWCQLTRGGFEGNGRAGDGTNDGMDIDESGAGNVTVSVRQMTALRNTEQCFDFDESGDGNMNVSLSRLNISRSADDGIQITEEDDGNLRVVASQVISSQNAGDGMEVTEGGAGNLDVALRYHSQFNRNKGIGLSLTQAGPGTGLARLRKVQRNVNRGRNTVTSGVTVR